MSSIHTIVQNRIARHRATLAGIRKEIEHQERTIAWDTDNYVTPMCLLILENLVQQYNATLVALQETQALSKAIEQEEQKNKQEELMPFLEHTLQEYLRTNNNHDDMDTLWSTMYGALHTWFLDHHIDSEHLIRTAMNRLNLPTQPSSSS